METTSLRDEGLMAAWIATGGAGDALREEAAGDDGLAATSFSQTLFMCAEDGLEAGASTVGQHCLFWIESKARSRTSAWHCADDEGLEAGGRQTSFGCLLIDDGLKAGYRTGFGCYADDGLKASQPTYYRCFFGDDGLTAGGYASTIGAFCW